MSLAVLKQQLNGLVSSMYEEGLLDRQFDQLIALQDANNPGFIEEVINLFCQDSERILLELGKHLVGAQLVKLACVNFRQVCEENDKEGCMQALNMIEREYCRIRNKFETMVQLEQRILAYSTKQQ